MYRMQFRLKDKAETLFKGIIEKTGEDPKDVVMDALALYHVALDEIANGRSFGAYNPGDKSFEGVWTPMLRAWREKHGNALASGGDAETAASDKKYAKTSATL